VAGASPPAEVDMDVADLPRPVGYVLGGGGSLGAVNDLKVAGPGLYGSPSLNGG
jgi:hypothetical protein